MVASCKTVSLSNIVRKFLLAFVHTVQHSKYNRRWYNRCRQKSYRCPFPHCQRTLTLFVQFSFSSFLHNILIWPAVSTYLSLWLFLKLEWDFFSSWVIGKHWSCFVIVPERAFCNLQKETKWNNVICEINSNR